MEDSTTNQINNNFDNHHRFIKGNNASKGNPYMKNIAKVRKLLLETTTKEELLSMHEALINECKAGSIKHLSLFFSYVLGKPKEFIELSGKVNMSPEQVAENVKNILGLK